MECGPPSGHRGMTADVKCTKYGSMHMDKYNSCKGSSCGFSFLAQMRGSFVFCFHSGRKEGKFFGIPEAE